MTVEDKRLEHIKYQAENNIRNMSSPDEILAIVSELIDSRVKIKKMNHDLTDADYWRLAYYNMLGPKALEVVKMWRAKGVQRVHFDWGPKAFEEGVTGEDRAEFIIEVEVAPKHEVKFIDDEPIPIDEWLGNNNHALPS